MTNVQNTDAQVAGLAADVRHNEKSIDLLREDLKAFQAEVNQKFEKVNAAISANRDAIAALSTKQTIGFFILAVLIVFQDQVSSLIQVLRLAAR